MFIEWKGGCGGRSAEKMQKILNGAAGFETATSRATLTSYWTNQIPETSLDLGTNSDAPRFFNYTLSSGGSFYKIIGGVH